MADAVSFFDGQFRKQIAAGEFALNPFEQWALPALSGKVADIGCGLGNLALAAAARGCRVSACDASPAAVERLAATARERALALDVRQCDLAHEELGGTYDAVVAIGLLMFFARLRAEALLAGIQRITRPGGIAVVNVLIEGTTFLDMFGGSPYTLFGREELQQAFAAWQVLDARYDGFDAPGGRRKEFVSLMARKPA